MKKGGQVQTSAQLQDHCERDGDPFLHSVVTCNEVWVHSFVPETRRASMEWQHKYLPPLRKVKTTPSVGRVTASVFWDSEGIMFINFLTTANHQQRIVASFSGIK
jgi:hypothetical protein